MRVRKSVLLVEDEAAVRAVVTAFLASAGYRVTKAATVATAREILAEEPFDLVIAGARLPDGRGEDLARAAEQRGVKTLVISGDPERLQQAAAAGVPHLGKPFRAAALAERVADVLAAAAERKERK
jgi:DNA-binding NtrC family response regulator